MPRVSPCHNGLYPRCLGALIFLFCAITLAQEPVKNEHIVEMKKARIEDATVIRLIEAGPAAFDTSVRALIALKQAGVSDKVIDAIVASRRPDSRGGGSLFDIPEETGVFVNIYERLVPLKVEIITWRTGGFLKTLYGNRGHLNGMVGKPTSVLLVDSRPEFVMRVTDGVAPEEFQLLKFWEKNNRREFRLLTGGVIHASSGAAENAVGVDAERIAPRTYRVRPSLPLQNGEYAFLPPGAAASASAASSGKVYTFRVEQKR